ncbi:uncharacterized protein J4E79_002223 [Alternaria viburni]|uniref:uncharacterized protein n=1 Tax=Alternaria viburni TaxID=566460 RepID=UPI0020C2E0A0|nr:uncharacterized protein J4E79_002223 [Alternaria viburni]KAI4667534.1 hypothetical protein J4E79_002223 [Alternaria viburni]
MPQPKSLPKDRYTRQRLARATRRHLASLTPSTSHPQQQSLFFTLLPAEIRFTIYQHVLSQQHDPTRPIDIHSISPLYRPLHTYLTKIDTSLLLTCRLIYIEAHQIPLRSSTHHFRYLGSTSWLYNGDIWLHHTTSQRGAQLYHLHDNLVALKPSNFTKFLLSHLHWRRITWTICAYLLPPLLAELKERQRLVSTLASLTLPSSCQEVTLEFETREDLLPDWPGLESQIEACRVLGLKKRDGSVLERDDDSAVVYTWRGSGHARWGTSEDGVWKEKMRYCTTRLCWRARVPRREYASYDFLDCLNVEGDGEGVVESVRRLGG